MSHTLDVVYDYKNNCKCSKSQLEVIQKIACDMEKRASIELITSGDVFRFSLIIQIERQKDHSVDVMLMLNLIDIEEQNVKIVSRAKLTIGSRGKVSMITKGVRDTSDEWIKLVKLRLFYYSTDFISKVRRQRRIEGKEKIVRDQATIENLVNNSHLMHQKDLCRSVDTLVCGELSKLSDDQLKDAARWALAQGYTP